MVITEKIWSICIVNIATKKYERTFTFIIKSTMCFYIISIIGTNVYLIKERIFKCLFLLTNDLKNEKNLNILLWGIFLFPSSKQLNSSVLVFISVE